MSNRFDTRFFCGLYSILIIWAYALSFHSTDRDTIKTNRMFLMKVRREMHMSEAKTDLEYASPVPEDLVSPGRLKIFFGYAAEVGKTYAMLEAAHQAQREGIDVVVG